MSKITTNYTAVYENQDHTQGTWNFDIWNNYFKKLKLIIRKHSHGAFFVGGINNAVWLLGFSGVEKI